MRDSRTWIILAWAVGLSPLALGSAGASPVANATVATVESSSAAPVGGNDDDDVDRELGAHLGVVTGGRVSAGGLRIGGVFLYRLSTADWFEGGLDFVVGSGAAACSTDEMDEFRCNHGAFSGRSGQLSIGIRRFFAANGAFTPYAHVDLGVRLSSFPDDDVRGVAIPATVGGGVRARINDLLTLGAGAAVEAGVGWFSRSLGIEPQLAFTVNASAAFRLR